LTAAPKSAKLEWISNYKNCPIAVGKLVKLQHGPATVSVEARSK
jgi:hypothetical protein